MYLLNWMYISKYFQKANTGRGDNINKYQIIFLLTSSLVFNVTAVSTNNRILFGTLLAGSALATSLCMYCWMLFRIYDYHEFKWNLLTKTNKEIKDNHIFWIFKTCCLVYSFMLNMIFVSKSVLTYASLSARYEN